MRRRVPAPPRTWEAARTRQAPPRWSLPRARLCPKTAPAPRLEPRSRMRLRRSARWSAVCLTRRCAAWRRGSRPMPVARGRREALRHEVGNLDARCWLVERDMQLAGTTIPFVLFGPYGVLVLSASEVWTMRDLSVVRWAADDLGAALPDYPHPIRSGIYVPGHEGEPRWWCNDRGGTAWILATGGCPGCWPSSAIWGSRPPTSPRFARWPPPPSRPVASGCRRTRGPGRRRVASLRERRSETRRARSCRAVSRRRRRAWQGRGRAD